MPKSKIAKRDLPKCRLSIRLKTTWYTSNKTIIHHYQRFVRLLVLSHIRRFILSICFYRFLCSTRHINFLNRQMGCRFSTFRKRLKLWPKIYDNENASHTELREFASPTQQMVKYLLSHRFVTRPLLLQWSSALVSVFVHAKESVRLLCCRPCSTRWLSV